MAKSYQKGWRGEKEFRDFLEAKNCEVIWHNEDKNLPDLTMDGIHCEVKYGTQVPIKFYKWLNEKKPDILAIRRVSEKERGLKWLIVMEVEKFFELLK